MTWADSQQEGNRLRKKRKLVKAGARNRRDNPSVMPRPEDLGEDANIAAIMGAEMDAQYADDPEAEVRHPTPSTHQVEQLVGSFFAWNPIKVTSDTF